MRTVVTILLAVTMLVSLVACVCHPWSATGLVLLFVGLACLVAGSLSSAADAKDRQERTAERAAWEEERDLLAAQVNPLIEDNARLHNELDRLLGYRPRNASSATWPFWE